MVSVFDFFANGERIRKIGAARRKTQEQRDRVGPTERKPSETTEQWIVVDS